MKLGVNLPWGEYGWDIGRQAEAADGSTPATARTSLLLAPAPQTKNNELFLDLIFSSLKQLGIQCVRLFLLADGVNLSPPTIDENGKWQVPDTDMYARNQAPDFVTVLDVCVRQKMQIMPVFVDYLLFAPPTILIRHFDVKSLLPNITTSGVTIPPGTKSVNDFVESFYKEPIQASFRDDSKSADWREFIKGGRAPILRSGPEVDSFLKSTLVPLLEISSSPKYRDQVLAWDIINEPEVAIELANKKTAEGGWLENLSDPVGGYPLAYFIRQSARLILAAKMNVTVGFQTAMPLGQDDGFKSKHQSDIVGEQISEIAKLVTTQLFPQMNFLPQCHYYPSDCGGKSEQNKLVSKKNFRLKAGNPLILGEFATKINAASGKSPWGSDVPGNDSVTARLQAAKSKGYDWAFPWSATNGLDDYSRFDQPTQNQYKAFQP
jgi:hypothetical protein